MAVIELGSEQLKDFFNFAKLYEYKSISFISRMYIRDKFFIPSKKTAKIFCQTTNLEDNTIKNSIMITSGGIILPLFSELPPERSVLIEMLKKILNYNKKIFCILGVSRDAELIKNVLSYSSCSSINYILLVKKLETAFIIEKNELTVKSGKKKDSFLLFPLEEAYLLEEVLVETSSINKQAALLNLKKTLSTQNVFYAVYNKEIIAKVNTNAKGLYFNQIGGVYTKPQFRNKGISNYLMKHLLNNIYSLGKNAVLYVKNDNIPALTLYKHLGFKIIDNYSAHYLKP